MSRRVKRGILNTNKQMVLHEEEKEILQELVQVLTLPARAYDFSISRNVEQV